MRVLIAAGGTGGHIYPGIAVAKEIMRRDPSSVVRFVGTAHGLETRLVPNAGFELSIIESAGLKNVSLMAKVRGLLLLPPSIFAARRVIRDFHPDIVVGAEIQTFIHDDDEVIRTLKPKFIPEEELTNSKTGETRLFQT